MKKDKGKKGERKEREKRKGRERERERHGLVDTDAGKGSRKCPLVRGIYM